MSSMCAPIALKELIETKEFRILSCPIWRTVQTNTDLSVESRFLWTVLWELCAPDLNYSKALTWGFLSKRIGKSESTVRRWARQLQKAGYLTITDRYRNDGSQLPGIFQVGIPKLEARKAMLTFPNRKVKEQPDINNIPARIAENVISEPSPVISENENLLTDIPAEQAPVRKSEQPSENTDANILQPEVNILTNPNMESGVPDAASDANCALAARIARLQARAKVSGARDQLVSNTQVAESTDRRSDALTELPQKTVDQAEKRVGQGVVTPAQPRVAELTAKKTTQKENNNNSHPHGEGLRRWIQKELENRDVLGADLGRYVEEFAVSIEKGSLKKFSMTKAINVALKLVREGRWSAPRYVI